jgi:hypothetical protein
LKLRDESVEANMEIDKNLAMLEKFARRVISVG